MKYNHWEKQSVSFRREGDVGQRDRLKPAMIQTWASCKISSLIIQSLKYIMLGKLSIYMQKKVTLNPYLSPYTKINSN